MRQRETNVTDSGFEIFILTTLLLVYRR